MWYQGYGGGGIPPMGKSNEDSPWKGFDASNLLYVVCYAESDDGINWRREGTCMNSSPNMPPTPCFAGYAAWRWVQPPGYSITRTAK